MTKYKVLISAYACGPNKGSEPGMGWNFVTGLAKYHEVHVISEKLKWEKPISDYLKEHPELQQNLKFYFIHKKRNKRLRKIWPPSYYWFYKDWQKQAYQLATQLEKKETFNLVHQLNMVGYREPGYLWKIDKPFVWGPIGGLENSPWSFLPRLGLKGMTYFIGRNLINSWQRSFMSRPKKAAKRENNILLSATPGNTDLIKKLWDKEAIVVSEVGQESNIAHHSSNRLPNEPLKIIWSGKHTPGKNLPLLLEALCNVTANVELHILGVGEMTSKWKKKAAQLNVTDKCIWHGWLEKDQAVNFMKNGHVFCITSVSDLTATVTLEALSYGLPIICLDHCGFSHVVNAQCGIKIPVDTPKKAIKAFSIAIDTLYNDENYRQKLKEGALLRAKDFNWDNKVAQLNTIYTKLLS